MKRRTIAECIRDRLNESDWSVEESGVSSDYKRNIEDYGNRHVQVKSGMFVQWTKESWEIVK